MTECLEPSTPILLDRWPEMLTQASVAIPPVYSHDAEVVDVIESEDLVHLASNLAGLAVVEVLVVEEGIHSDHPSSFQDQPMQRDREELAVD